MSFSVFKGILDQARDSLGYLVLYNLGEPTLNREIYDMIAYAKGRKIFTRLSTNADFDDKRHIRQMLDSGVDEIVVSLDCPTEQTYAGYKGCDDFRKVIDNVRGIVAARKNNYRPFINLQMLIMRSTEPQVGEFKRIVKELGVDRGIMKKVRVDLLAAPPQYDFLPMEKKYVRDIYKKKIQVNHCWRPWLSAVILWDGMVVPCCLDMAAKYDFGNINEEGLRPIWQGPAYAAFREEVVKDIDSSTLCGKCSIRDFSGNFVK